jgi:hypothetical protein
MPRKPQSNRRQQLSLETATKGPSIGHDRRSRGQGFLLQSRRGVVFAAVDGQWWGGVIHNLMTKSDPRLLQTSAHEEIPTAPAFVDAPARDPV